MARTLALLCATFGRDLGGLVDVYFTAYDLFDNTVAIYGGNYERCMLLLYARLPRPSSIHRRLATHHAPRDVDM